MKLPSITMSNRTSCLGNSQLMKERFNPFKYKMEKVLEIKIFLNNNFQQSSIKESFIKKIEDEYAVEFLLKMEVLPTKKYKMMILEERPIEQCDFHLTMETIRNKQVKIIHIFPNQDSNSKTKNKLKAVLSSHDKYSTNSKVAGVISPDDDYTKEIMKKMHPEAFANKENEGALTAIQSKQIKEDEMLLFNREKVDNMFQKAKEDIINRQLFSKDNGVKVDLTFKSIKAKYLNPSAKLILPSSAEQRINNLKGKLSHISKVKKKNILDDKKFEFPLLETVNLTDDILKEVTQPIDCPVEAIIKDLNYILDNFPIEEFFDFNGRKSLITKKPNNSMAIQQEINSNKLIDSVNTKEEEEKMNLIKSAAKEIYTKIESVSREEMIYVYKQLQSMEVYRVIGLCMNLIYWVVFGNYNRIQIDYITRQYMYIKLLKEIQNLHKKIENQKLLNKVFIPLLILILRLECENILTRKFTKLFENGTSKEITMEKVNELITSIFDPHCYYNTFTIINGNAALLKHKMPKNTFPNYKGKICATSNLLDQMFIIPKDIEAETEKTKLKNRYVSVDEANTRRNYILNQKKEFFSDILEKVNNSLRKRNLEPIFSVSSKLKKDNDNIRYIKEETEE
ncbi:MAG: hypothetical protein MJ252_17865, partial [archaeon]|nr:hypothetical protein [archaeon]